MTTNYSDLVDRLRGIYRVPIDDGAGPLNGEDHFTREFPVTPIMQEAANAIETLSAELSSARCSTSPVVVEKKYWQYSAMSDEVFDHSLWCNLSWTTTFDEREHNAAFDDCCRWNIIGRSDSSSTYFKILERESDQIIIGLTGGMVDERG